MKTWLIAGVLTVPMQARASTDLATHAWSHGSQDCAASRNPAIEVYEFDASTYILRQSKCLHFEAPFTYVLFGEQTVFILDTGASEDAETFPLYNTVQSLISRWVARSPGRELRLLVTHSHSHSDHTAADSQFRDKPGVTLVEPTTEGVRKFYGFTDWPAGFAKLDLGGRTLEVVPAPGHQDEGIAVYDRQTGWLLTGDNLYPGRLYLKNWNEYRSSIARLDEFAKTHEVSAVLGSHIEMSSAGTLFPVGNTFQPDEASLVLSRDDLSELNNALQKSGEKPREISMGKFAVAPIGTLQRVIGGVLKWIGVR